MDCLHNLNAEQALLGAAIQDMLVAQVVAGLPEHYFTDPRTQATHRAIKRIVARGGTPELQILDAEVACDYQDTAYLIAIMQQGFNVSATRQYEALLAQASKRRTMLSVAQTLLADAANPAADADALEANALKQLQTSDSAAQTTSIKDALIVLYDKMQQGDKGRLYTGIADLDAITGGFAGSQLIYLAARPGVGKTAIGLFMASHIAKHTGDVLVVSLEMDDTEIAARALAAESGVDLEHIVTGKLTTEEWLKTGESIGAASVQRMHITCRASTPLQVRREAVRLKARGELKLIVIDYVQLMHSDTKCSSRYEEITAISRDLKQLAMDLQVPILSMCQLNRQSERGFGRVKRTEPIMADARDSGALEQDANLFLILHEPEEPEDPNSSDFQLFHICRANGLTWQKLKIEKNRQGRTGVINLGFDKPHMRYTCITTREDKA